MQTVAAPILKRNMRDRIRTFLHYFRRPITNHLEYTYQLGTSSNPNWIPAILRI